MKIAHISLSDWRTACQGMTFEEEGFYWRLTCLMYANDGVFPDNDRDNATIMGIHNIRTYRRLKARLLAGNKSRKPVIKIVDGHIVNRRLLEEIEKTEAAKKAASAYGKAGAEARWKSRRLAQKALPLGESLPQISTDIHPDKRPIITPKKEAKTKQINELVMATPYSNSTLQKKKTPIVPLDEEDSFPAKVAINNALVPEGNRSVAWTPDRRLQVFNGFRAELLEKFDNDPVAMQLALDAAVEHVDEAKHGMALMKAVRAQMGKQAGWRRERQIARAASSQRRSKPSPGMEISAQDDQRMRDRDAEIWGRRRKVQTGIKETA